MLVVPAAVVEDAFAGAIERVWSENRVLSALNGGMSTVEAFATFGVM